MTEPTEPDRLTHAELAPETWFKQRDKSSVWVTAYRMFRVRNHAELARQPIVLDFTQARVRAHMYVGDLRYTRMDRPRVRERRPASYEIDMGRVGEETEPSGAYLVLVTPFEVDGASGDEPGVRQRLTAMVGLMVALQGRNAAYEQVFENIFSFGTGTTSISSKSIINPLSLPEADLGDPPLSDIVGTETAIEALADSERARVRLSLRWHLAAAYDSGADAVLKHWIALETLTMPSTSDIGPLVELLARAHGAAPATVREELSIGRIYGLRNRIVHDGRDAAIDATILDHMANLYCDALREFLGRMAEHRASRTAVDAATVIRVVLTKE